MDESSQQAISIGVNITIFIIALSISLTLMFSVRDMAKVATELDKKVPNGAVLLSTNDVDERIINGYELISYYYNYIVPYYQSDENEYEYNHPNVGVVIKTKDDVYKKEIIDGDNKNIENENTRLELSEFENKIDLNAKYTLSVKNHYDNTNTISGTTVIYIEQIPELAKGEIYNYYITDVKKCFVDSTTNNLFENSKLNIVYNGQNNFVNVNKDVNRNDEEVKKIIDDLESGKKYSVRIKRNNPTVGMKAESIILYIEEVI